MPDECIISACEAETMAGGEKLGRTLKPGDMVALRGGLGAGKTVFTRGIAAGLGIVSDISSPTFTIVNEYHGPVPLFHFDMYRLESEDELFDIGWDDYATRGGVCVVEWSEKVPGAFDSDVITVTIDSTGAGERRICISRNKTGDSGDKA